MGRKAWQYASMLPAAKLSQVHKTGINTSPLVEHAYNPIHRRYQYDPAGELVRTLDKLRGEIKYEYEATGIANESWNLTRVTPGRHASMDAYRNLGWGLQSVTKTIAQW